TLKNIHSDPGYTDHQVVSEAYPGAIEFSINPRATVTVVNIVTIEDYLRGVLPAEMPATYPFEALKAQAVAARTKLLETMNDRRHVEDGYDICDDSHCQTYAGKHIKSSIADRAVAETRGLVVVYEGKLIDAVYSACCGGHTEDAAAVWGGDYPYLHGRIDADVENPDNLRRAMATGTTVRQWVKGTPNVFCNQSASRIKALSLATDKAFRWQKQYTVAEISDVVRQKTGRDVGRISDFQVIKRGVSGRIIKLKIVGNMGSFILENELEIRRALASVMLKSSCFVVDRTVNGFVFSGAGFGHGVGMCQNGAAGLALTGKKFHEILRHYYRGTQIISIY
ncbi:SpoIID/LytB domain-containing protein, partial [bacterium]|nr:SpoIID/LytB domain-containing protein [bacterium]